MTDEFERQVDNLIAKGYPQLIGVSPSEFREQTERLRELAPGDGSGGIAFVVVVPGAPVKDVVEALGVQGVTGFKDMSAENIAGFTPIEGIEVPGSMAYLITDVDLGHETLNVTPNDALPRIRGASRSPLTIAEGLAVIAQFPDALKTHNAFSMLGSRSGDKRVPALWMSQKKPKFGWCWAGNPHTWLGSASCAKRLGV